MCDSINHLSAKSSHFLEFTKSMEDGIMGVLVRMQHLMQDLNVASSMPKQHRIVPDIIRHHLGNISKVLRDFYCSVGRCDYSMGSLESDLPREFVEFRERQCREMYPGMPAWALNVLPMGTPEPVLNAFPMGMPKQATRDETQPPTVIPQRPEEEPVNPPQRHPMRHRYSSSDKMDEEPAAWHPSFGSSSDEAMKRGEK